MAKFLGALRVPTLASAPGSPVSGQVYYDTVLLAFRVYNGTSWQTVQATSTPVLSSNQISGVGNSGQIRAGRAFTAADFTTLLGLSQPVGLFNLGNATNLGSAGGSAVLGKTVTITIASPAVITTTAAHGLTVGQAVTFATTGALPAPLVAGTTYYVTSVPLTTTIQVSATQGGTAINTTGGSQSGTHNMLAGAFGKGITGATPEAVQLEGNALHGALYVLDTGSSDPFRIRTGSWGCWMRTPKRALNQSILTKWGTASQFAWSLQTTATNLAHMVVSLDGGLSGGINGITDICDDRWHFVVCTFDGSMRLYVDGVLESSLGLGSSTGVGLFGGSSPLNIGGEGANASTTTSFPFYGRIDAAFVTGDVLDETQIRILMAAKVAHGLSGTPTSSKVGVRRRRRGAALVTGDFPASPRRLYNFTGGSVTDAGLDNQLLTITGSVTLLAGPDGLSGGSAGLVGSGSYLSSTDATLPTGAATMGLWFRTVATGVLPLIQYGTAASARRAFFHDSANGGMRAFDGTNVLATTVQANDGQWHFAALVFSPASVSTDGLLQKMYIDGRLIGTQTALATVTPGGANAFRIGNDGGGVNFFGGEVSRVFITDYAMTTEDLYSIYSKGSAGLPVSEVNPGDHVEAMDATNVYCLFDSLEPQHAVDLSVVV